MFLRRKIGFYTRIYQIPYPLANRLANCNRSHFEIDTVEQIETECRERKLVRKKMLRLFPIGKCGKFANLLLVN